MARPKKNVDDLVEDSVEEKIEDKIENNVSYCWDNDPTPPKSSQTTSQELPQKESNKEKLERIMAEDTRIIKGRFYNMDFPGSSQRFQMRKYPNIKPFDKILTDGEVYEIPIYVARWMNGVDKSSEHGSGKIIHSCAYPTHGFKWNEGEGAPLSRDGDAGIPVPIIGVAKWNKRFRFESMEFDINQ